MFCAGSFCCWHDSTSIHHYGAFRGGSPDGMRFVEHYGAGVGGSPNILRGLQRYTARLKPCPDTNLGQRVQRTPRQAEGSSGWQGIPSTSLRAGFSTPRWDWQSQSHRSAQDDNVERGLKMTNLGNFAWKTADSSRVLAAKARLRTARKDKAWERLSG